MNALTAFGRFELNVKVFARYGRKLNWDTLRVEWRQDNEAHRQLIDLNGNPFQ